MVIAMGYIMPMTDDELNSGVKQMVIAMGYIMPMTDDELKAIEDRANAATEGPWACEHTGEGTWGVGVVDPHPPDGEIGPAYDEKTDKWEELPMVMESIATNGPDGTMADARFIAHARMDVPALIAEIRRLRA